MAALSQIDNERVYCHRGWWSYDHEQNSDSSLARASEFGFSVETDLRNWKDEIIISHDIPQNSEFSEAGLLLEFSTTFALNIKTDGLQKFFMGVESWIESTNSFVFDGSIPQMLQYAKLGIPHAMRLSEYEWT